MKKQHDVVIVGAGPTGLMLAGELALAGVDVAIVERRANQDLAGSRASGLHMRTLEILDQRGIAGGFIDEGQKHPALHFHLIPLDVSDTPTRHNYVLALMQNRIERLLADWIGDFGVPIHRGCDVTGFTQDDDGVDVALADGRSMRARWLVGCDGGRSVIRKAAGIAFPGVDATTSWIIAEAEATTEPKWGFVQDDAGIHAIGKSASGGARIVLTERTLRLDDTPTLDELREALVATYGSDFGIHTPTWLSRFTDMTRQADQYRDRRVLFAGDAAHVHPPVGGKGLNLGVQDAVNLGWKLAAVVHGTAPETLLDTYHAERHPATARVLRDTLAQVALRRTDAHTKALSTMISELLALDEPRRTIVAEMSGLALRYDFGDGHPLLGRRMPNLDIATANGATSVYRSLHAARPVLINFDAQKHADIAAWTDRVDAVDARCDGPWTLPAIGTVPAPDAVLVRPDGYVAWVGRVDAPDLTDALTTWFGAPRAA
jgi:3-(3-hydroxy-phenyl)propionate hydroxylase